MKDHVITAGVDIGSTTAQAVILEGKTILSFSNMAAGVDRVKTAHQVLDMALAHAGLTLSDVRYVVGTGYGRHQIPFANRNITEITCHARGASYFFPQARTVLDMGGQDCKAISLGPEGKVLCFVMNDKCAAGTGRSIEVIARLFQVPLEETGSLSLQIQRPPPQLSSGCVVFAKSEALKLIRNGSSRNEVLAAYFEAMVQRVLPLIQRVSLRKDFVISGGVALNQGVVKRLEEKLKAQAHINSNPQIVGAVGAALIAQGLFLQDRFRRRE
jgi:predicted CoA-substrate-specific enzyme activase